MKPVIRKKNASVELLRIIAAIMVVGVHVNTGLYYFDSLRKSGCLVSALVADGVAIFWMIMGFYLFNGYRGYYFYCVYGQWTEKILKENKRKKRELCEIYRTEKRIYC